MPLKDYQQKILSLMIRQELQLAELYTAFSERVPELKDFWITVQREELEHAQWLEHMADKAHQDEILFHEDSVRTYTVQAFLHYLDQTIATVRTRPQTVLQALALASGVEESLLERKVFDHFDQDNPDLKAVLSRLREETREHFNRIHRMRQQFLHPGGGTPRPRP